MSLRPHSGKLIFTSRLGWVLILSFVDKHVGRILGEVPDSPPASVGTSACGSEATGFEKLCVCR